MILKMILLQTFIEEVITMGRIIKFMDIPMTKSTEVLYVNKNLLEQLGYTVDDLKDLTFEKLAEISQKAI